MVDALTDLATAADRLNAATEALNALIEAVEARISGARIGVSVWLDLSLEGAAGDEPGYDLGYCRVGENWVIAIRRRDGAPPQSLLSAPRVIRVEAAAYLGRLVEALTKRAEGFAQTIEEAKGLI